ncbi:MerR family transcriptional regulator [Saccharopolyspora sp. 5N708]|uniref:MerR family transcriptional regulator n=1 Tax=Saccharopolyspora sp. 5N708 TaxID=3457424 RepID=UPI003FD1BE6F
MRARLTIGEFAALTQLSVRTLRRYHEAGLLAPASVDPFTGYRYYEADQIPSAQVIHRLRELDLPLAQVKAVLATGDPTQRAAMIASHLERLEVSLDRTRAAVISLRRLLRPEVEELEVELRSLPARQVAAISAEVDLDSVTGWYDIAMAKLDAAVPTEQRTGPPGGRYDNELFTEGSGTVTVFRPFHDLHPSRGVEVLELPAVELAVTTHRGPHDDIGITYGRLGEWVVNHTLAVAGPVHETYLAGPRDTNNPELWHTEIGWPIFRLAS